MKTNPEHSYRALFTLPLLLLFLAGYSQEWASNGATWYYSTWVTIQWTGTDYTKTVSEKDTLVDGKMCRKLVVYSSQDKYLAHHITYNKNDSVFFWQDSRFYLLFDFSAEKGDTVRLDFQSSAWEGRDLVDTIITVEGVVTKTDSLMQSNLPPLKEIYVDVTNEPDSAHLSNHIWPGKLKYTEQLGTIYGSSGSVVNYLELLGPPSSAPYRCYEDKTRYYMLPNWRGKGIACDHSIVGVEEIDRQKEIRISPNPATHEITVRFIENDENTPTQLEWINLAGQFLSTQKVQESGAKYDVPETRGIYLLLIKDEFEHILHRERVVVE